MRFGFGNRPAPSTPERETESSPSAPWLLVGLGNPGAEYRNTRHNVGFLVLDRLSEEWGIPIARKAFRSLVGEGRHNGKKVVLIQPQTYMNLSGQAVREAARFHRAPPEKILVICDDVNLPLGRLRLRGDGSHGGQNGLKSVIADLGTDAFPRLRVGVGLPEGNGGLIDHVLGKWGKDEVPVVRQQVERAAEAVRCVLDEGLDPAMNRFNAKT
jgi:PTH1 family peptidyl-tRNA hydrolase